MDRSTEVLLDVIRTERARGERPASQERRRVTRLAAEIARCCRTSFLDRLVARIDGPASASIGAIR